MTNKYSFTFIDDEKDYSKKSSSKKDSKEYFENKVKKLDDDRRAKLVSNYELHKEFDEFVTTYSKAYEYKLLTSNTIYLINEIMNILKEVGQMNEPHTDTYREDKVREKPLDYPGWISYAVRQNICTREKARILFSVLNKGFSNSIISFIDFVHKDISLNDIKSIIESRLKEHGVNLYTIQFNLGYVFERVSSLKIEPKFITNSCMDCKASIKRIIDCAYDMEILLRLFSIIKLEDLKDKINA
jgi:hypothetical protein